MFESVPWPIVIRSPTAMIVKRLKTSYILFYLYAQAGSAFVQLGQQGVVWPVTSCASQRVVYGMLGVIWIPAAKNVDGGQPRPSRAVEVPICPHISVSVQVVKEATHIFIVR